MGYISLGRQFSSQQSTHYQQLQLKESVKPYEAIPRPGGRLPLLGHMHKLDMTKPWETLDRWRQEHGEIYRLSLSIFVQSPSLYRVCLLSKDH